MALWGSKLRADDVVADRFVIEDLAGSGGMARVYLARDRTTGMKAALKIMGLPSSDSLVRFEREAEALARLQHPSIVRYLAHGALPDDDRHYLAMDWIEGQTLSARLRDGAPMSPVETLDLGIAVADALEAAHEAGVIHRDVKPSNLILGAGGGVTLIDFGVARVENDLAAPTGPGMLVGTPGFVSPEQARGTGTVGPPADLFSLGCVLYACLTGHAPFRGEDLVAVLAKILFQATPHARDERRDIHPEVDALVAQLMAKEPDERFSSAREAKRALSRARSMELETPFSLSSTVGISTREARLCAVVFVGRASAPIEGAKEIAARFSGALEKLANGTVAVRWIGAGSATERAAAAARCALALQELAPASPVGLATVRGEGNDPIVATAIDRAAELVRDAPRSSRLGVAAGVGIDETTAGLLDAGFDVRASDAGLVLLGEREPSDDARRLLGISAPFVGRDREIALLDATLAQTEEDGEARALLVLADAGVGKTRLRQEWVRRLKARDVPPAIWMGRADPLGTRASYGLIAQAIRRALDIRDDEPLPLRRARVRERVSTVVLDAGERRASEVDRIVTFVSELVGAPFEEEGDPSLFAARRDPMLMGDQLRRAFIDFLAAEASARPVVLVLEDPHWGDAATLRLVDAALATGSHLPLLVAAFARPTLETEVPSLWGERRLQTIRLEELSRKASERLARAVLPGSTPSETIERVVALAHGNAFFLEELVRAVAEGRGDRLPDTVLAVVESRFESFEPEARRFLRAASVFGQFFWKSGVAAILGDVDRTGVDGCLDTLLEREVVTERRTGRFGVEPEYAFRHAIVRDAAYATLTDDDRRMAHATAASWLSGMGEQDPAVLAAHFELGGNATRAAEEYAAAASRTIAANDFAHAFELAQRGIACKPSAEVASELWSAIVDATRWQGETSKNIDAAKEVMTRTEPGSDAYRRALACAAIATIRMGRVDEAREHLDFALRLLEVDVASPAALDLAANVGIASLFGGDVDYASRVLRLIVERRALEGADAASRASVHNFWAFYSDVAGDLESQIDNFDRSATCFLEVSNLRWELLMRVNAAYARGVAGLLEVAEAQLRELFARATQANLRRVTSGARLDLTWVLEWQGRFDEARKHGEVALADFIAEGDKRLEAAARCALARVLMGLGDQTSALVQARRACDLVPETSEAGATALATRAWVAAKMGEVAEAVEAGRRAASALSRRAVTASSEPFIHLAYAQALQAADRTADARDVLGTAHQRVLAIGANFRVASTREAFLTRRWENAQILGWWASIRESA